MSSTDDRETLDAGTTAPTHADLLARVRRGVELGLRVAAPARVVAYNPALQRADLTLELLPVLGGPEGVSLPQPPIALPQVPVAWPRTAAGYLTLPIVPGDTGLVVFCDRSISQWLQLGAPTDPISGRTHNLADGVFFPGLHADTQPIVPPTSSAAAVLEGPLVWLGSVATHPVPHGDVLVAAFTAWTTAMATAGAAVQSPGVPDPTGALYTAYAAAVTTATAALAATLATWLSTKVLAQ